MKNLKGKNVVITGAASGIGKIMARLFAAEGARLALVDIAELSLSSLEEELAAGGAEVKSYPCDISRQELVKTITSRIRKELGRVDVMVNNAGIVVGKTFFHLSLEEMERTMNVYFWGHVYFTRAFIDEMMEVNDGVIVNVASSGGLLGMPSLSDYCASKFADVGLSESLRRELKRAGCSGVKVTCICPYIIDTGMFRGFKAFRLNPILKPEDVARKIVKAVKKGKPYVLKLILPTRIFDWILGLVGSDRAMESFSGRAVKEGSNA